MMKFGWIISLLGCLSVAASACGSTPETRHYRLDLTPQQMQSEQQERPVLGVEYFSAAPAYDETQIVYRTSPYLLKYYYYHRWSAAPGLMMTDALQRGYARTGLFETVTVGEVARADVILSGYVVAIEEVDVSEEEWLGRIALDLRLRDSATGTLLWSESYMLEEPLEERSPEGLARAISAATTEIVEKSAPEIAQSAVQLRRQRYRVPPAQGIDDESSAPQEGAEPPETLE